MHGRRQGTLNAMPQEPPNHDSLLDFLRGGILGPIQLGMPTTDLRKEFGDPDDVSIDERIWLYGSQGSVNIQIAFYNNQVSGVSIYFLGLSDVSRIPTALIASQWTITGRARVKEFTDRMDGEEIEWRILEELTFDEQLCVALRSGVLCLWSNVPESEKLQKIILTPDTLRA